MAIALKKQKEARTPQHVPRHIAIIMDGNGRWANKRKMPRIIGHKEGVENIRRILTGCVDLGIESVTVYAFSTENWNRPLDEVRGLMTLLEQGLQREVPELHKNGVRIRHIGRMDGLSPHLQKLIRNAVEL